MVSCRRVSECSPSTEWPTSKVEQSRQLLRELTEKLTVACPSTFPCFHAGGGGGGEDRCAPPGGQTAHPSAPRLTPPGPASPPRLKHYACRRPTRCPRRARWPLVKGDGGGRDRRRSRRSGRTRLGVVVVVAAAVGGGKEKRDRPKKEEKEERE